MSRDVYRKDGYFAMKKMQRLLVRIVNMKFLGVDVGEKKWWQFW